MLLGLIDRLRLLKHFFSSAKRRGITRTLRISLFEVWFEHKFRSATGLVIPAERLDYDQEARQHAQPYFPSSYLFLYELLAAGPIDCRGHVFIDFGSGMGRALLFASTLSFKKIIGVELSPSLCKIAEQNLKRYYKSCHKNTPEWTIANADARHFSIPTDATLFYMANPFDAIIVAKVLDNIVTSLHSSPRKCYLVYANPIHERLLLERGFEKTAKTNADYVIYTNGANAFR